jgi:hypothetical protein
VVDARARTAIAEQWLARQLHLRRFEGAMDFRKAADTGLQDRKCAQRSIRDGDPERPLSAKHRSVEEVLKFGKRLSIRWARPLSIVAP